jgi:hypothetical protein
MKAIALSLLYALAARPLAAQVSGILPQRARDALAGAERRSPTAQRNRQRHLDSLAAGRRRWALAGVAEYRLQVHADCNCVYPPGDSIPPFPLLTVRDGAIVSHARGKPVAAMMDTTTTVDSLFAQVERDISDVGRVVSRLDLDPRFGFPRDYAADTPTIADVWLAIHVDSFAALRRRCPADVARRPPNERCN